MFKTNQSLKDKNEELQKEILSLTSDLEKLKKIIDVKDLEIIFYKERGDRYLNGLDNRENKVQQMFDAAIRLVDKICDKKLQKEVSND